MAGVTTETSPDAGEVERFRLGMGNWNAFKLPLEKVERAAERWKAIAGGVERPWLCWNVDDDWCLVQQRLVTAAGWTPLVGNDPRLPQPRLLTNSVFIDFNADFGFPTMWMHFPLEFAFMFVDRL